MKSMMSTWSGLAALGWCMVAHAGDLGSYLDQGRTSAESPSSVMVAQVPLVEAADELTAFLAGQVPSAEGDGFASLELDVAKGLVSLYWKSDRRVPKPVTSFLTELESRKGIRISVGAARFSNRELTEQISRILAAGPGLGVTSVSSRPHGAGLAVEVDSDPVTASLLPAFAAVRGELAARAVNADPSDASPHLALARGAYKTSLSRDNDSSPWWGGARINIGNSSCTSGFAVGNIWGNRYMLTANHCVAGQNGTEIRDGVNQHMGVSAGATENLARQYDTALIYLDQGSTNQGIIYHGGFGPPEVAKWVKSTVGTYTGQFVCMSGSFSGSRCDSYVLSTNNMITLAPGAAPVGPMVKAEQLNHSNAAGLGDSGSPVFTWDGTPEQNVRAAGTAVAGDTTSAPAACTGVIQINNEPRACSWRMYYPAISSQLGAHGVFLITYP